MGRETGGLETGGLETGGLSGGGSRGDSGFTLTAVACTLSKSEVASWTLV